MSNMPTETLIIDSKSSSSLNIVVLEPISASKICPECNELKLLHEFSKDKSLIDGLNRICRGCYRIHQKLQRKKYKLPILCPICKSLFNSSKHYKKYCCEKCSKAGKEIKKFKNLLSTRSHRLEKAREYRRLHPNYMTEYWKTHKLQRKNNSARRRLKLRNIKEHAIIRITDNLRKKLRKIFKNCYGESNTLRLIGCSKETFIKYYESKFTEGMNWEKVMSGEIHCDHIRPCASFDLNSPSEQSKCFHYTNLQPLWAIDNLRKGDRYEIS